ncbi:hypothetical protein Cylst_6188 [Cylindrospermum stagnale PCC 7417]|uniref:Uncharacterized protein n=1 Tax=Cylindrospermum stagnale PCC 7417 TaxID=56107 RepID=K9X7S2_9NOST|nr:hypothetical protein [Cylindrospermum stagnale]AFZ28154.1 hypothetical protein Cylst_6188 [Cylindrospermum stagnale PCC 7417]
MKSIIKLFPQTVVLTLALTSLLACGIGITSKNNAVAVPSPEQLQLSQNSQNTLPKAISRAVLRDAAKRSGVRIAALKITQVTSQTFSNPCLFNFGEICTKEYNPIQGWEVIVQVQDQSWTYHVNKSGSQIVLDPKVTVSSADKLPKEIASSVLSDASKRSGLPSNALKITQATQKTFSNPCFFGFGEVCTQIFDPVEGWLVIVKVKQQSWTYHVNQSGEQIVLDPKVSATPSK